MCDDRRCESVTRREAMDRSDELLQSNSFYPHAPLLFLLPSLSLPPQWFISSSPRQKVRPPSYTLSAHPHPPPRQPGAPLLSLHRIPRTHPHPRRRKCVSRHLARLTLSLTPCASRPHKGRHRSPHAPSDQPHSLYSLL